MAQIAEPYIRRKAIRHLEKGRVVIFAAGTGNPFFTTDTTAALRAVEIDGRGRAEGHPLRGRRRLHRRPQARPDGRPSSTSVTYIDVLNRGLTVMDPTAITFCMDNDLPIVVFDVLEPGNLRCRPRGQGDRYAGQVMTSSTGHGSEPARRFDDARRSPTLVSAHERDGLDGHRRCCRADAGCGAAHQARHGVDPHRSRHAGPRREDAGRVLRRRRADAADRRFQRSRGPDAASSPRTTRPPSTPSRRAIQSSRPGTQPELATGRCCGSRSRSSPRSGDATW